MKVERVFKLIAPHCKSGHLGTSHPTPDSNHGNNVRSGQTQMESIDLITVDYVLSPGKKNRGSESEAGWEDPSTKVGSGA